MSDIKTHIVTAVAVIVREDGKILVLKRSAAEKVYPSCYTFPGGKVEDNDTLLETLDKEVKEECGLTLKQGAILIKEKSIGRPDGSTSKSLSFLCTIEPNQEITLDNNDFTDYKWVDLEELRNLDHVGTEAEFIKAKQIVESGADPELFFTDTDKVDFRSEK